LSTRRFLLLVPLALALILLQSYFWVPTYEQQARGNPGRLERFINASIGDASILNPILSSDSASSEIENLVFEGLIDRDENLRFRGRIASGWNHRGSLLFSESGGTDRKRDDGCSGSRSSAAGAKESAEARAGLPEAVRRSLDNIGEISAIPPQRSTLVRQRPAAAGRQPEPLTIAISAPARIKLVLKEVDQDLFTHLEAVLGRSYFSSFQPIDSSRFTPLLPQTKPPRWRLKSCPQPSTTP